MSEEWDDLDDLIETAAETLAINARASGERREFLIDACGWSDEEIDAELKEMAENK